MKLAEAAERLGVSPRRVRAMIADGRLPAHRTSSGWEVEALSPPKGRRSLSMRSWGNLSGALKHRTLEGLSGQDRSRTAARIRQLRETERPSRLLVDWQPPFAGHDVFMDSLVVHAERGGDAYIRGVLHRPAEYLRDSDELALVVAAERTIRGRSRRWLAEAAGVSERIVRDIEMGRPLTEPGAVRQVLGALEIEPTALPDLVPA